eukprot:TRINITY_DN7084_c0_g1_i1.p1 TRINITY_DN7084_c0_g1~~TRINITY_DN7084_c0_g1_i1.p1  ORF type:complete len:451 (+),score=101.34 TRINITY_DN7084_c0_g1_i1:72-1355(+)
MYDDHINNNSQRSVQFAPTVQGYGFPAAKSSSSSSSAAAAPSGKMKRSKTSPVALSSFADHYSSAATLQHAQMVRNASFHYPPAGAVYPGYQMAAAHTMYANPHYLAAAAAAHQYHHFGVSNVHNNAPSQLKPEFAQIPPRSLSSSPSTLSAGQPNAVFPSSSFPMTNNLNSGESQGLRRTKSSPTELASLDDGNDIRSSKRLARKAEAARASRRRKKAYVQSLEDKFARLSARLAELESGPDQARAMIHEVQRNEQKEIRERLDEILASSRAESHMDEIRELLSAYIRNGRKKQNTAEYYLGRCETALAPSLQVKFAMWGLGQSDDFYDQPGIWRTIMGEEIGLSEQQLQEMKKFRNAVQQARGSLQNVCSRLKKLKDNVRIHVSTRERHIDDLASHLNPLQIAKFCNWVDKNPLCMQMLNTVWKL